MNINATLPNSVFAVVVLSECIKRGQRYYWSLTFEEAIEIGYSTLYWISASEISESKGLKLQKEFLEE